MRVGCSHDERVQDPKDERVIVSEVGEFTTAGNEARRLENSVEKEFAIPFGAKDGRVDHVCLPDPELDKRGSDFFDGCLLSIFVPYDSALSDQFPAYLELGLHQDNDLTPTAILRERSSKNSRENQGRRDEGHIYSNQLGKLS